MALGVRGECELNLNGNRSLTCCNRAKMLKLPLGGQHVKHAEQSNVEFGYNSAFALGPRNTTEDFDRVRP
jgi:hypothetical protein